MTWWLNICKTALNQSIRKKHTQETSSVHYRDYVNDYAMCTLELFLRTHKI